MAVSKKRLNELGFKTQYDYKKYRKYINLTGNNITVDEYYSNQEKYDKVYLKYQKEYISRTEIKEKKKERQKEYRDRPEIKEKRKEYRKEYYNRTDIKERQKEYYKEYSNRPEIKEKQKEKYQKQKELKNQEDRQLLDDLLSK